MDDQKQQIIDKLQAANNILVTVPASPSADQLSACIGLTLLLNKMNKHATAVFSGQVPSIIEFLKPEETLEKNTDSLRDFIIALDKAKADKLRYKVEDEVVKIFITPYKASISDKDLIFSQGDFNVDVVMALGVHKQQDLDEAITAHGRILHDAVVISVTNTPKAELGTINWQDQTASSLSEMVTGLVDGLGPELLDDQISTAFLTGIVAETDHFGNLRTTPQTMTMSATLLAAGANQQLVATQLGLAVSDATKPAAQAAPAPKPVDGQLAITHDAGEKASDDSGTEDAVKTDEQPTKADEPAATAAAPELPQLPELPRVVEPLDSKPAVTASAGSDSIDSILQQAEDELAASSVVSLPDPKSSVLEESTETAEKAGKPETLTDIEKSVHSPHVEAAVADFSAEPADAAPEPAVTAVPATDVDNARQAVEDALQGNSTEISDPIEALNAVPVDLDLGHEAPTAPEAPEAPEPIMVAPTLSQPEPASDLPAFLQTSAPQPTPPPLNLQPLNPAANEPAPLHMSPADQPFTMPLPPQGQGLTVPPPLVTPPTSSASPPQGPPPPPPVAPPLPPAGL